MLQSAKKLRLFQLLKEKRKRQCEDSLYEFTKEAFKVLNPQEEFVSNWHIKYICDVLQDEVERIIARIPRKYHLIINIPPRSLKSIMTVVAMPAWAWIHAPHLRFIGTSYSNDLSLEHNIFCKTVIESNWYQELWGDKFAFSKDQNTKEYFRNTDGGFRRCTSTGGSITGSGGDIIIVDDALNPKMAASDRERQIANIFFDQTLTTRLDNPAIGMFIIIAQRLHDDDLPGHLLKKHRALYRHICIPAELQNNIQPMALVDFYKDGLYFPERHGIDFLNDQKINLGSYGYAGQFLQNPFLEGGGRLNKEWFKRFVMEGLPESAIWNFAVDPAYTAKTINDPSALMAFCIHKNNVYIRNVSKVWKEFPGLIQYIKKYALLNGYTSRSRIYIEPKASGLSAAQSLKTHTGLNVVIDDPPSTDKVSRCDAIAPIVESGRVFLLEGETWTDDFLYECSVFPLGKYDDQVDVLIIACNKIKMLTNKGAKYIFFNRHN